MGGSGYDDGPMDTLKCIHLHQKNKTKLGKYAFGHMKVNAQTNIHICMYVPTYVRHLLHKSVLSRKAVYAAPYFSLKTKDSLKDAQNC